jgi:hypothetical protein
MILNLLFDERVEVQRHGRPNMVLFKYSSYWLHVVLDKKLKVSSPEFRF